MSTAKVELGRRLFHDTALSGNRTQSCATCHRPDLAFTDGRDQAVGSTGELHPRGAMSLVNVAYARNLNWADPVTRSLEEQMLTPLFGEHPVELGLADREDELIERLRRHPGYVESFAAAFPAEAEPVAVPNVVKAIAAFERTLISGNSAYDRWLFHDEPMSESSMRGMRLFFSERLACSECHSGINLSGPIVSVEQPDAEPEFHNTGLYNLDGAGAYPRGNRGLFDHTGRPEDVGRFRAPTLRNIAITAPYMHDGSIATLDAVLDHYAAGGRNLGLGEAAGHNPLKSEAVAGFDLTSAERADMLAFLHALTSHDPGGSELDGGFATPPSGGLLDDGSGPR